MTATATRPAAPGGPGGRIPEPAASPNAPRAGLAGLAELPGAAVRSVVRSARTTPGRLTVIAVGLVVLALLAGVVATITLQERKNTINDLIDHREPLAAASQEVYRSLSDADATAASTFLAIGVEPPALRQRYDTSIARAGVALGKAASDSAGVPEAAAQVQILTRQLPVYTGLVETARANKRQGFPVGSSYLREASDLMRSTILPAAQDLYRIDTDRLAGEQDDASGFPWVSTLLVLALLAALVATQVYLTRKTNRVLNVGLVVATAATVLVLLWGAAAVTVQSVLVGSGDSDGSHQVDVLVRTRIAALQARANEMLTLVARGDGGTYERDFDALAPQVTGLLAEAKGFATGDTAREVQGAADNAQQWLVTHQEIRAKDVDGAYSDAVKLAVDSSVPGGAATTFAHLDDALVAAIGHGRQAFLDDTRGGDRALTLLAPGVAVLAVIAAAGATMGIRDRLREYR
ncbi:hypothetical protein [Amycolatopsis viridis]|uniref:Uncharacterized protein YjbJ (UPF0337 family) n=1 Tax=Amycolatopsis viridis TaxID=185678 RepID=A0ABX0SRK9_9PSEU|nr:hypothetical protein [Amycolatopsis viridis]NIH77991.1 uncharacterized protein YjbJ (UPF0337 family) [Amycolatopsis viridis]